jgi:hypothetical protein
MSNKLGPIQQREFNQLVTLLHDKIANEIINSRQKTSPTLLGLLIKQDIKKLKFYLT